VLRRRLGEKAEGVAEDGRGEADAVVDVHGRRREFDRALLVAEAHVERLVQHLGHAVELEDEVHVPRRAAELPIRDGAQAGVLLQPHDVTDGVVLDAAQLVRVHLAGREALPCLQQLGRAQEAADVVGAEGRPVPGRHQIG
jgi:hypothetical protein